MTLAVCHPVENAKCQKRQLFWGCYCFFVVSELAQVSLEAVRLLTFLSSDSKSLGFQYKNNQ